MRGIELHPLSGCGRRRRSFQILAQHTSTIAALHCNALDDLGHSFSQQQVGGGVGVGVVVDRQMAMGWFDWRCAPQTQQALPLYPSNPQKEYTTRASDTCAVPTAYFRPIFQLLRVVSPIFRVLRSIPLILVLL